MRSRILLGAVKALRGGRVVAADRALFQARGAAMTSTHAARIREKAAVAGALRNGLVLSREPKAIPPAPRPRG